MNTAGKGGASWPKNGRSNGPWKLSVCRPKWFRFTRTSRPPISSCPPFFVLLADSASKMSPAHVPHVGLRSTLHTQCIRSNRYGLTQFTYFTNSRSGSRRFDLAATKDMVVLSPPGKTRPSHVASSCGVRTSMNCHSDDGACSAAFFKSCTCSKNAPCRARTPTVIAIVFKDRNWGLSELGFFLILMTRLMHVI